MKAVLSLYAFTLFTPQLALEVILLLALLLVTDSLHEFRKNSLSLIFFVATFSLIILFVFWQ